MIDEALHTLYCLYVGKPILISKILFLANNIGDYDEYKPNRNPIAVPI